MAAGLDPLQAASDAAAQLLARWARSLIWVGVIWPRVLALFEPADTRQTEPNVPTVTGTSSMSTVPHQPNLLTLSPKWCALGCDSGPPVRSDGRSPKSLATPVVGHGSSGASAFSGHALHQL